MPDNSMSHDGFDGDRVAKIRWLLDHGSFDGDTASVMQAIVQQENHIHRLTNALTNLVGVVEKLAIKAGIDPRQAVGDGLLGGAK